MRATILALVTGLFLLPAQAFATPSARALEAADATLDLVVFRPLQATALAIGAVAFVPVAVLASPCGLEPIKQAWEHFAGSQVDATFRRELGDF